MLGRLFLNYGKKICAHSKSRHVNFIGDIRFLNFASSIVNTRNNMSASRRLKDLIVLVDMDGVLAEFEGYFLEQYKQKWPGEPFVSLEERRTFYLYDQYPDCRDKVQDVLNEPGFFRKLPPIEGAVDAVKEMSTMNGVQVFICTTPMIKNYQYSVVEKYEWIEEHMGRYWLDRMILTCDKTVIKGDILIDDKHFISGAEKRPSWKHILFTSCHNHDVPLKGRKRLDGWVPHKAWIDLLEDAKEDLQRKH
ncbi:5'(3')-deoxyribonucleotidase, cytosolic type-like [Lineus longissimus]|uniref:5'(3')-deoxyribonucleotidase, cytosolic type-like n=1 Tax=Lineus longissimus TaxID=88925 RepID=UPI002B4F2F68